MERPVFRPAGSCGARRAGRSEDRPLRSAFALALVLAFAAPALAQSTSTHRRWEIEGYGGVAIVRTPDGGTVTLPPAGPPIATSNPQFPSRGVPTWFFGDGARLVNDASAAFGLPARIAPFDEALASLDGASSTGAAFGVRARRQLTVNTFLEAALDISAQSIGIPGPLEDALEASRASFGPVFTTLFGSGPFTNVSADATRSAAGGSGQAMTLTGAWQWQIGAAAGFRPYLTGGGGVIRALGDGATSVLEGRYRAVASPQGQTPAPFDETDRLTLRVTTATTWVGVAGGGLSRAFSERLGLRIDARVHLGPNTTRAEVDAHPVIAPGSPAGFVELLVNPALQFSNDAATGRRSSLGDTLDQFEVFAGTGLQTRFLISGGITIRF
jgi:hypothetical protein